MVEVTKIENNLWQIKMAYFFGKRRKGEIQVFSTKCLKLPNIRSTLEVPEKEKSYRNNNWNKIIW